MITVQNSNSHLASHTVAPQITGMHDTMFFCSYGMAMVWKKIGRGTFVYNEQKIIKNL